VVEPQLVCDCDVQAIVCDVDDGCCECCVTQTTACVHVVCIVIDDVLYDSATQTTFDSHNFGCLFTFYITGESRQGEYCGRSNNCANITLCHAHCFD
jgi:hypothetical protein